MKINKAFKQVFSAAALSIAASNATAGPVLAYDLPINFSSQACANYGDAVSCSAQYLNYLTTGSPSGTGTTNYVLQSPQGVLQQAIVIMTGGQAATNNTDIGPNIDNAYRVQGQGSIVTYGTSINAGQSQGNSLVDPTTAVIGETNNGGAISNQTAWDIGLQALTNALTIGGQRRDLLFFFDNNQTGVTEGQNILASSLLCVRDAQGLLADKCFELIDQNTILNAANNVDPTLFNTSKGYGSALGTDPLTNVVANGTLCVSTTTKEVVAFNVASAAACPAGSVFINNNLGTNQTEFIVSFPELNAALEQLIADGYDLLSVQLLFQNNTNGFEDVFILAGAPKTQVPVPGTLLLLGLGLAGLGLATRRRS